MRQTAVMVLCVIAGLCASLNVSAQDCDVKKQFNNLEVKIYKSRAGCSISAGQTYDYGNSFENRYRSFTFSSNGQVMMFVNTNDNERMSRATGSRCFHLLPFRKPVPPSFVENSDNTVTLTLPSGHKAVFSTATGDPVSIEGFSIKLAPLRHISQTEKNRGFVEITPLKGFLLFDYGWRTGEVPMSQLYRDILVADGNGVTCKAKMSDVFKRDPKDRDEVIFLHDTSAALKTFVSKKCPKISYTE